MTQAEARTLYMAGNNRGDGYAPDAEDIDDAIERMLAAGSKLVIRRATSDDVAVVETSIGERIAIGGDAMGGNAWAVLIRSARRSSIKINVYRDGSVWFGARWIDGVYDGCDSLDIDDDAPEADALEAARTLPLARSGDREVNRVDDIDTQHAGL